MNLKHKNIMKKNIIRAALFAVFAFVAGYSVYTSQKETAMSDLAMANVEALASGEDGNYDCDAPYTATCSYEGSVRVPGVKR